MSQKSPSFAVKACTTGKTGYEWDLLESVQRADVVYAFQQGTESSMNSEHRLIDHCTEGKTIARLHKGIPNRGILVILHALMIESKSRWKHIHNTNEAERNRLSWFPRSK